MIPSFSQTQPLRTSNPCLGQRLDAQLAATKLVRLGSMAKTGIESLAALASADGVAPTRPRHPWRSKNFPISGLSRQREHVTRSGERAVPSATLTSEALLSMAARNSTISHVRAITGH